MSNDEEGAYLAEVRRVLGGQWAPEAYGGGRRILYRCPKCTRIWLQDGARVVLELSAAEIARYAVELSANVATLPGATCRICAAQTSGTVELDEYRTPTRIGGYGVNIEGAHPPGMHLMLGVFAQDWTNTLRGAPRAGVVTDFQKCRAVVAWSGDLDFPAAYHPITLAEARQMAAINPPGHRAPGTASFIWRGADWLAKCPPLGGGWARVTLSQAMPPDESFSFRMLFKTWRELAPKLLQGKIAGEPAEAPEQ